MLMISEVDKFHGLTMVLWTCGGICSTSAISAAWRLNRVAQVLPLISTAIILRLCQPFEEKLTIFKILQVSRGTVASNGSASSGAV